jgi:carbon storage regulator CsrA
MLVLSRRPNDRILFPALGITIQVVRVDGRNVRLGIEAPRDVHVVRHELAGDRAPGPRAQSSRPAEAPALSHAVRNQLQSSLMALHLLQRQIELDQVEPEQIERQLESAIAQLNRIEAGLEATHAPAATPGDVAAAHPRRTALLVEDNLNERALLAAYLQSFDYDVATADDGAHALEYLATHERPDVVLLDMNMPHVGGAATVQVIRSNPDLAGVKLFAVSGLAPRQVNVTVGKGGVDHWFTKPIRPDLLVQEMDRELTAPNLPA